MKYKNAVKEINDSIIRTCIDFVRLCDNDRVPLVYLKNGKK